MHRISYPACDTLLGIVRKLLPWLGSSGTATKRISPHCSWRHCRGALLFVAVVLRIFFSCRIHPPRARSSSAYSTKECELSFDGWAAGYAAVICWKWQRSASVLTSPGDSLTDSGWHGGQVYLAYIDDEISVSVSRFILLNILAAKLKFYSVQFMHGKGIWDSEQSIRRCGIHKWTICILEFHRNETVRKINERFERYSINSHHFGIIDWVVNDWDRQYKYTWASLFICIISKR